MEPFKWMEALRIARNTGRLVDTLEFLLSSKGVRVEEVG